MKTAALIALALLLLGVGIWMMESDQPFSILGYAVGGAGIGLLVYATRKESKGPE